jgi:hypothetical protein
VVRSSGQRFADVGIFEDLSAARRKTEHLNCAEKYIGIQSRVEKQNLLITYPFGKNCLHFLQISAYLVLKSKQIQKK